MEFIIALLAALGGLAIGAGTGYYGRSLVSQKRIGRAESESTRIVEDAKEQSRAILIEAKEESLELRKEGETEIREQRSEIKRSER
ncbi:MAG: Rnase Y domain-containing protein, partial [SAR202 cluster bacterium]|nr:Rnase Y domain-containing protein [SAR202 cluster bacterium]